MHRAPRSGAMRGNGTVELLARTPRCSYAIYSSFLPCSLCTMLIQLEIAQKQSIPRNGQEEEDAANAYFCCANDD